MPGLRGGQLNILLPCVFLRSSAVGDGDASPALSGPTPVREALTCPDTRAAPDEITRSNTYCQLLDLRASRVAPNDTVSSFFVSGTPRRFAGTPRGTSNSLSFFLSLSLTRESSCRFSFSKRAHAIPKTLFAYAREVHDPVRCTLRQSLRRTG